MLTSDSYKKERNIFIKQAFYLIKNLNNFVRFILVIFLKKYYLSINGITFI